MMTGSPTRRRVEYGRRLTMPDLPIEGGQQIFAVNDVKLSQ